MKQGSGLFQQMRRQRSDQWVTVSSEASIVCGERNHHTHINHSARTPASIVDCVMRNMQIRDHIGTSNTVPFEDSYGH